MLSAGIPLLFAVLVCGCTTIPQQAGAAVNTTPDLIGNWSGTATGYLEGTGFADYSNGTKILRVTDQKGRIFHGRFLYPGMGGGAGTVEFAGAIARDGKTMTIAEQSGGYSSGTLVSPAEIELIYASSTDPVEVAIDLRKKG